jgi:hypothetical protein
MPYNKECDVRVVCTKGEERGRSVSVVLINVCFTWRTACAMVLDDFDFFCIDLIQVS